MTAEFRAAAPARLDLAGGWTDVPPFSAREGGVVVTLSVALHAEAQVRLGGDAIRLVSDDLGDELEVAGPEGLAPDGRLNLLKAGLRMLPVGLCTLRTRSDTPPGSGLGSSGALDVALVAALSAARGERPSPREIADLACRLEAVEAGVPGGRQDQFAAAHGGALCLRFRDPAAEVEALDLEPALLAELERRTVLCYTGVSRFSGATITRVMRAYEAGSAGVIAALHGIRDAACAMVDALRGGDLARVGSLLSENWRLQRALDEGMCTPAMARLEQAMADAGALGGKAAGAGAGGCMFFLGPDDPEPAVRAALELGARVLPVRVAADGVRPC